jgi:hypothetical protein
MVNWPSSNDVSVFVTRSEPPPYAASSTSLHIPEVDRSLKPLSKDSMLSGA